MSRSLRATGDTLLCQPNWHRSLRPLCHPRPMVSSTILVVPSLPTAESSTARFLLMLNSTSASGGAGPIKTRGRRKSRFGTLVDSRAALSDFLLNLPSVFMMRVSLEWDTSCLRFCIWTALEVHIFLEMLLILSALLPAKQCRTCRTYFHTAAETPNRNSTRQSIAGVCMRKNKKVSNQPAHRTPVRLELTSMISATIVSP